MTHPSSYLVRMVTFLILVGAGTSLLGEAVLHAFASNSILNGFILFVLLAGILWNLRQVHALGPEVRWLETYQVSRARLAGLPTPRLLAPMAAMLATREAQRGDNPQRLTLSAMEIGRAHV